MLWPYKCAFYPVCVFCCECDRYYYCGQRSAANCAADVWGTNNDNIWSGGLLTGWRHVMLLLLLREVSSRLRRERIQDQERGRWSDEGEWGGGRKINTSRPPHHDHHPSSSSDSSSLLLFVPREREQRHEWEESDASSRWWDSSAVFSRASCVRWEGEGVWWPWVHVWVS